jgi:hypothetical protein
MYYTYTSWQIGFANMTLHVDVNVTISIILNELSQPRPCVYNAAGKKLIVLLFFLGGGGTKFFET